MLTVSGVHQCPTLEPPVLGDGVVDIVFGEPCGLAPPPSEFTLYSLLEPLPAGIWQIRLIVETLITGPPIVLAQLSLTVTDPDYSVAILPSPATEVDETIAHINGFGFCPFATPDVEPGHIRLRVDEAPCPPGPIVPYGPFQIDAPLGQLAEGDYLVELFYLDRRVAETTHRVLPAGVCLAGETTLCLNDGRFRVEVGWTTASGGPSGQGKAVDETTDTGFFWFFNPENIELVVKVLDACETAFESFWVFAGGLTDVGVVIDVTDTQSG
ncbi:MAG: hypothetical protein AAF657_31885, partial [Acidobacteriota bacterium]